MIEDILSNFECLICKAIPIDAQECDKCEVIFCYKCIEEYKTQMTRSKQNQCPQCRQTYTSKTLNKNVTKMTREKLQFRHQCMDSHDKDKEVDESKLSAIERFKRSDKYKEILIAQGKLPPDALTKPQTNQISDE